MSRVGVPQVSFSAGEVSPLLHRRYDYQRSQTGLAACRGFIPLRQGGITRAPGTIHRGSTRNDAAARLVPFEFAENDALILEFTANFMRVWRYGQLVMSGASPYQLATPFGAASLPRLQWVQSADVIYIADGLQPIQKLSRLALSNWTIAPAAFNSGPFRVQNLDETSKLQASGATGTITLTSSAGIFKAGHVGSLIRMKPVDQSNVPLWTGNTTITVAGQKMRYDGKTYVHIAGGSTGVNPPTHDAGTEQVSTSPDVKWRFVDDGSGICRITGITNASTATATVLKTMPQGVIDDPTYRWEEGAWSALHGYPAALELYDQRLVAAATPSDPRTLWFSTIGDYQDFEPGVEADSAFAYAIAGDTSLNKIQWLRRGRSGLHIGAMGEEYSTRSENRGQAIGPTTTYFGFDSSIGSRVNVRPIVPDGSPMFVAKDGKRLIVIDYSLEADANRASELSLPAQHIGAVGFAEIAWQGSPQRLAWIRRDDGTMAVLVYDPAEEILGWAVYPVAGGSVEAMAVSPSADGSADVVTLVVARTVNGQLKRFVEDQALTYGIATDVADIADAVHYFAASVQTPASPTDTFNVPHLVGQQVRVWTDLGDYGPLTVDPAGVVQLPITVGRAVIGLFDATHYAETLDLLGAAPDGSTMGRQRRITKPIRIGVHRTAAGQISVVEKDFAQAERAGDRLSIIPRAVAADLTSAYSGVAPIMAASGMSTELALRFYPEGGAPLTITAIIPPITEAGL